MTFIHQWTNLHKDFIAYFLGELERNRIQYFILRNYEELPEYNTGKDIDVVIAPNSYARVQDIILYVMSELDVRYYQVTKFEKMRCWYIMDHEKQFGIHIDIIENEVYKGFEFFRFEYLYKNTERYKSFTVLNKPMDTVMLLIQNLVAYKSLKSKYRVTIEKNYDLYKNDINKEIISFWGKKTGQKLITLLEKSDFDSIVSLSKELEKKAIVRIFNKRPLYTIRGILRFLCERSWRVILCPRKFWRFIAVEAPDGTGKTTFINNLIVELRKYYVSDEGRFRVHHFRPNIFPNLGAAGEKAGVMKQDKNFTEPHRAKPAGSLSSLIRMFYYWLDYVIGIPIILRKEVHYEQYTIFDRYIYDFLVDPHRSRINLPKWVRKCFSRLVIQPQIIFVLNADPEVIYKRKQELPLVEISRQLKDFQSLKSLGKHVVFIDANQAPDEMSKQAVATVLDKFLCKI